MGGAPRLSSRCIGYSGGRKRSAREIGTDEFALATKGLAINTIQCGLQDSQALKPARLLLI